ncbi:LysE family transporter [Romeria aff. gracilis LEGE 07310]|uniref:LysE family transporter n=1 Tax=Vasconcelosia minhoensis LEGE 07310 TaxID=915328 RepID=A0A8J7AEJ5_9CYAN|nr:LysE family transporter [Romeria gracilis]MBE9077939.1 LysE family transporter [Romeria aff. gracilis LEGE 07310]
MLLQGLLLGFALAAPVGPIGLLCIRRTLDRGRLVGLVSGLGAATADGFYGFVAAFGLTFISQFLIDQSGWLQIGGGLFLCYLGITTALAKPATTAAEARGRGIVGAYFSTLALTLTNPATILSFVAIFAGFGIAQAERGYLASGLLVIGVTLGSALWWLTLSTGVSLFRQRLTLRRLVWLNRAFGLLIFGFGIVALSLRG